jgi:AraC-like DNA-binding protein
MARNEAIRAVQDTILSGFRHHSYEFGQQWLIGILQGGEIDIAGIAGLNLELYADVLGPTRIRSIKNSIICLITVVARTVLKEGVDSEQSFALSDFYINEVEKRNTRPELTALLGEILAQYQDMVKQEQYRKHSLPVARAIRYINRNIYGRIRVAEIAAQVKLNPRYFSSRFKAEAGETPSQYIKRRKMEEARELLARPGASVGDTAEALGYCSLAHFSNEFKQVFGKSPRRLSRR